MVQEYLISKNRRLELFISLILLFGCINQNSNYEEGSAKVKSEAETLLAATATEETEIRKFSLPDSSIKNKLKLDNEVSLKELYSGKVRLIDSIRQSPVAAFSNESKSQYLLAYQYEGNTKNAFSCFEIGYSSDGIAIARTSVVPEKDFSTESGLKLGMPVKVLIAHKGKAYKLSSDRV